MVRDAVLSRVRETALRRRAMGGVVGLPQTLLGLDDDEMEGLEHYPWKRVLGSRSEVAVRDLVDAPRETLVRRCYRLLLLRDPDEGEAERAERLLTAGWTPVLLVARVRWSAEGRTAGVPVRGLALHSVPGLGLSLVRKALAALGMAP
jgi:hypothetical protein